MFWMRGVATPTRAGRAASAFRICSRYARSTSGRTASRGGWPAARRWPRHRAGLRSRVDPAPEGDQLVLSTRPARPPASPSPTARHARSPWTRAGPCLGRAISCGLIDGPVVEISSGPGSWAGRSSPRPLAPGHRGVHGLVHHRHRHDAVRRRLVALLAAVLAAAVLTVSPATPPAAQAGEPSDYPESPYAATDYTEAFRGQFHFSPQNGFMNDINAPLYYRGVYHLFFQHNPHGLGLGHHPLGARDQSRPGALDATADRARTRRTHRQSLVGSRLGRRQQRHRPQDRHRRPDPALHQHRGSEHRLLDRRCAHLPDVQRRRQGDHRRDREPRPQGPVGCCEQPLGDGHLPGRRRVPSSTPRPTCSTGRSGGTYAAGWFVECPDLYQAARRRGRDREVGAAGCQRRVRDRRRSNASGVFESDWTSPQRMEWGKSDAAFAPSVWYAAADLQPAARRPRGADGLAAQQRGRHVDGQRIVPSRAGAQDLRGGHPAHPQPGQRDRQHPVSPPRPGAAGRSPTDPASDPLTGISRGHVRAHGGVRRSTGATATEFGFRLHARADGSSDRTVAYTAATQTLYGDVAAADLEPGHHPAAGRPGPAGGVRQRRQDGRSATTSRSTPPPRAAASSSTPRVGRSP